MLKNIINALTTAARGLFGNWRALSAFFLLYLALLLALYWLFTSGVATIMQVLFTFVLAVIIPVLFFVIQAMSVSYTTSEAKIGALLKQSLRDCWRLLVIGLPLLLLAWLVSYLLGRFEENVVAGAAEAARRAGSSARSSSPVNWLGVMVTALRWLLLYIALPLVTIQLWIAASRTGLGAAIKGVGRSLARALAPRSLLTYLIGFVFFAVIPHFLFFTLTPAKNQWLELSLLGARVALALVFIFFGWVVTLGALAKIDADRTDGVTAGEPVAFAQGVVQA
ncbi:MAG TPA: hypothetical protein VFD58_28930 [Blastocatellia bacterium]|nr:hypothetical protein [Blastocatellia bacterium]